MSDKIGKCPKYGNGFSKEKLINPATGKLKILAGIKKIMWKQLIFQGK